MNEVEKLDSLFTYEIDNLIEEQKAHELSKKELLAKKKEIAIKYAKAYYKIVEEVLSNPTYLSYSGSITSRVDNNVFGNYNISNNEKSSTYRFARDFSMLYIALRFDTKEQINFNVNEDKDLYDELMINDILYFYGIDIKSRNTIDKNVIYITFYRDKKFLKKNTETWFDGAGRIHTRKRDE